MNSLVARNLAAKISAARILTVRILAVRFLPAIMATIGLLTGPALAQPAPAPTDEPITLQQQVEQREKQDQERRARAAEIDQAYQRLQKSSHPAPAAKVDPWGNVRNAEPTQKSQTPK